MLEQYEDIHPGLADRIVSMAERSLDAGIEVDLIDKKAESKALVGAAFGVTFFPWFTIACAVILALAGQPYAALVTAAAGLLLAGPQIIGAIRRASDAKAGAIETAPTQDGPEELSGKPDTAGSGAGEN